jgi:hypothetical protein
MHVWRQIQVAPKSSSPATVILPEGSSPDPQNDASTQAQFALANQRHERIHGACHHGGKPLDPGCRNDANK